MSGSDIQLHQRGIGTFAAVAFDMDGLLVDTEPLWWRAEADVARALGGHWTEADSIECVGGPMEKVADIIMARAGVGDSETIIADVIRRVINLLATEPVKWLPGARELVAECAARAVPHALVSASPRPIVNGVLKALGTGGQSFAFTISAEDVSMTKPAPDPYLEAARRFGCTPAELLVFEDSPTGTQAALTSGAMVIAVPHVGGLVPHPRMHIATSLSGVNLQWMQQTTRTLRGANQS